MPNGLRVKGNALTILVLCVLAGCEAPTSTEWESSPSNARGSTSGGPTGTSTNSSALPASGKRMDPSNACRC